MSTVNVPLDPYDIGDDLFANRCSCGAPLADEVFCAYCRDKFEALIVRYLSCGTEPVAVGVLCMACVSTGEYCANCGEAHSAQHCPEIWHALRDRPIPYAMAAEALGLAA